MAALLADNNAKGPLNSGPLHMIVGSLNRPAPYFLNARGAGITVFSCDEENGAFHRLSETTDVDNPTYIAVSENRNVYAVSEVFGWKEGELSSYRFDPASGTLTYLNKQPTLGSITAHVSLDHRGEHVFVANYAKGSGGPDQSAAVFKIKPDGSVTPAIASVAHANAGIRSERQERPHGHCVLQFGDSDILLVTDLGLDILVSYRLRGNALEKLGTYSFKAGAGPRHVAIDPQSRRVFVINELDSTLVSLTMDENGQFTFVDLIAAIPDTPAPRHQCGHIYLTNDCRFLYTADRGRDLISAFRVAPDGHLSLIGHVACGGQTPRHFALTPNEKYLLVANQNADEISIFLRDPVEGFLTDSGVRIPVGTPMCVAFVR